MVKQIILIILLSLVAIVFRVELSHLLDALIYIHNYIAVTLHMIFSDDRLGRIIQDLVALLLIPFVAGFFVALAFWLLKRAEMPKVMPAIWVLWLILLTTMIAQSHMVTPVSSPDAPVPETHASAAQHSGDDELESVMPIRG